MGTTVEKLTKILQTKEAIRTAINNKGGTLTESDTFSSYSTAINNIQTGGGDNPMQEYVNNNGGDGIPSCDHLLYRYLGKSVDNVLNGLDTSSVTIMSYMFQYCENLVSIPKFNTSKVTDMRYMFDECSSLTSIPALDTSKVTDMSYMFNSCSKLTSIPQLNTSKVTNMSGTFKYCSSLKSISQLNTDKVINMSAMFSACNRLKK
jgi:surface protein